MSRQTNLTARMRLLHLEDNLIDAELISVRLRNEWPECLIERVDSRDAFLAALRREASDLVLSDFSLPAFNGFEALLLTRQHNPTLPFIFLSGTIGEHNAVEALRRGAVDYIIKDRPARLIPAIKRALEECREQKLRREAEHRLREQAELLDKARDAICVSDIEGNVTYWNQGASSLFGWTADDGDSRRIFDLFGARNQELVHEALRELHTAGAWARDMQVVTANGDLRHIISRWTLVRDSSHRAKSILIINTDVSEQKKLETQLQRAQRLDGIGTLAGGIAHDLNNVLTPILISANLLQLKLADEEMLRLVGMMEAKALHGVSLIRQVQAFARGAEGERAELRPENVITDVFTHLDETMPATIEIETDVASGLWPIFANATQLSQMLMSMGVNSREAMTEPGKIAFRARNVTVDAALAQAHPGAKVGPHVLITVEDNGRGIPAEYLHRIFDPFFTTKVAGKGAGLGLSTVLGIMKSHGGFLQVQSDVGFGTEFRLFFPAHIEKSTAPADGSAVSPPKGKGEMVLVIDDEDEVRALLRELLETQGYQAVSAENGDEGLQIFRERVKEVRAVIVDLMRPTLPGEQIIRDLRAADPDARIVALGMSERSRNARDSGRMVYLPKPMKAAELARALHHVMRDEARVELAVAS